MKLSAPDLRALPALLIRHGEKAVVALVGLAAAMLLWGGVDAVRSLAVKPAQEPQAIEQQVAAARGHIDREAQPPADLLPRREPLAAAIDPWRRPLVPWRIDANSPWLEIAAPPNVAVLDAPLFEERPKRTRPDVFPVEDLRAVAGIAVLPDAAAAGPGLAPPAAPEPAVTERQKRPEPGAGRRPPRGGDPLAGVPEPPRPDRRPRPEMAGQRGRIVPYVVVTGLIPVHKQQEEYRRRFENCGYQDPRRDAPKWCDYEIERAAVGIDGKETWTRIDLAAVAAQRKKEWGQAAAVGVDPAFLLVSGEDARSKQTTPIGFCSAMPQRLDGTWELADLHPWVVERLEAKLAEEGRRNERMAEPEPVEAAPGQEGPGFGESEERRPEPEAADSRAEAPEYRLFRFVDTDVQPGATYRYRVRLKVWNPNYDKEPERMRPHLADPALAIDTKLASPESGSSAAATVPGTTRIVVGTLRREELKELKIKPGSSTVEVLVLGPDVETGSFALRGMLADPGVVVDVDEEINKRHRSRGARGAKIVTGRLLVDARGRQEDRLDPPAEKEKSPGGIPEPFEVLCLRPDGSFELASVDGSERSIAEYGFTLPQRASRADPAEPAAGDGLRPAVPGVDPLSAPIPRVRTER